MLLKLPIQRSKIKHLFLVKEHDQTRIKKPKLLVTKLLGKHDYALFKELKSQILCQLN
ncbi:hypothetical protein [Spiroplasma poulsonii]|uniref:hypothetical protein n=1 Tax=Spiroplasma poulsonii TaxID=2138 RepID=UPI001F4CD189|nr:hypothetical protein [Spiroplasma poulsonii]UNF62213.1 hypothetical protein MNU24_01755 [Spiroplasma poulsonii]